MNQNMNSVPDASSHVTISNTWAVHVELSLKIYIFGRNNSWDEMRRLLAGEMSSQRPARYVVYIFGSYLGSVHLFIRPCYVPADAQLPLAAFIHFSYSVLLALLFLLSFFCFLANVAAASVHLFMSLFSKRNRMHRDVQRTHTGTLVVCATSSAISFCRSFWVASRCLLHFASLVLFSPRFTFSLSSQRDWNDSLSFPVTGRLLECWTNRFTNKSPTSRPVPTHLISAASLWISTTTYRVQAGESYYI